MDRGRHVNSFAAYDETTRSWIEPTILSMFAQVGAEFLDTWPRAGSVRADMAGRRDSDFPRESPATRGGEWPQPGATWPTPTARLGDPRRGFPSRETAAARMEDGRRNLDDAVALSPGPGCDEALFIGAEFVERLMGFPENWTEV